ncbi:MAG: AIPR family protein [Chitinophagales bacterium]|nr:AIPR family protein [Chitinophagales bacterium]
MAKNDKILIDGIIDDRILENIPSNERDEVFEYFVFEQLLKDYDLSNDELLFGNIDGKNDGGIDGFFTFVNGHLITDTDKFIFPKSGSILELWIITCKYHDTYRQAPLDNLVASISELFDFTLENPMLKGDYSEELLFQRENFKHAYRKTSPRLSEFKLNFCYASRGNTEDIGESIVSRGKQLEQIAKESFGNCLASFNFIGSTELIELNRKAPNFSLDLPFSDNLSSGETYILLVKLKDYYNFISDNGKLRRYLFDSNVRDFMGLNRVNEDIRNTLENNNSPDFWWLNNGITILATAASVVGKSIQIQDIQIVNGLQTSESIYRYFSVGGTDMSNRSLLVKVIVSNDSANRDEIIRATNNQTIVELASLHATDKIQRDIEEVLKLNDLYYERRTNYYKNQGIPLDKIFTPLYLASGYVSLILKHPEQATNLKSKFMRKESSYNKVFSTKTDLNVWPKITSILKQTDKFLETKRPNVNSSSEHFLKNRRQYLSFLTVSRLCGSFNFTIQELINFDLSLLTMEEFEITWELMKKSISTLSSKSKIARTVLLDICRKMNNDNSIKGFERIVSETLPDLNIINSKKYKRQGTVSVTNEFVESVEMILPKQPWKPGTHKEVANKLDCSENEIYLATNILIEAGKLYKQKDGILYDKDGKIVDFDVERVNPETFRLKE